MKKLSVFLVAILVFAACLSLFSKDVLAQVKSYVYDRIDFIYQVNEDSTVDVSEVLTYDFTGSYHTAYRDLWLDKVDDITDIEVYEWSDAGDQPLDYSWRSLDKLDPSSWGKYAVSSKDGIKRIEWYFDANNATRTWRINYTLHGSVSFHRDIQELYWDLFTSFEAPIRSIGALVFLPKPVPIEQLKGSLYYSSSHKPDEIISEHVQGDEFNTVGFRFGLKNISARETVTIAAGWPIGLVSQKAYFVDALKIYWPYILSVLLVIATAIYIVCLWYVRERKGRKKTVIAEYEPPKNFTPAMSDVIVHEFAGAKVWPATIVDLAVRGYIRIDEDPYTGFGAKLFARFLPKDFLITRVKPNDANIKKYEEKYLRVLLLNDKPFSTREFRKSRSQRIVTALESIKKSLYKEVSDLEGIYDVGVYVEHKKSLFKSNTGWLQWIRIGILFIYFASSFILSVVGGNMKYVVLAVVVSACYLFSRQYYKYEARLSMKGEDLKYQILGFKEFLKVTGKDRMQNLTPDIFEKYLPYAMVFGVEKAWAKKFEAMHLANPEWYGASGFYAGSVIASSAGASAFSASAFSSSLSSSFSSAMSSSGGGGASGGGGGAGGGGGGGGGGAS